jgi:hypothetical protein
MGMPYFLDRDGEQFATILNYLRTRRLPKSINDETLSDLMEEVAYYGLSELLEKLKMQTRGTSNSLINYHGVYLGKDMAISFVDEKRAYVFSCGKMAMLSVTWDAQNHVYIGSEIFYVTSDVLKVGSSEYKYMEPKVPKIGTTYRKVSNTHFTLQFNEDNIFINGRRYDKTQLIVATKHASTLYGVPVVECQMEWKGEYWNGQNRDYEPCPIIYCFGSVCIARSGYEAMIFYA